jgi:hypothetical protein
MTRNDDACTGVRRHRCRPKVTRRFSKSEKPISSTTYETIKGIQTDTAGIIAQLDVACDILNSVLFGLARIARKERSANSARLATTAMDVGTDVARLLRELRESAEVVL